MFLRGKNFSIHAATDFRVFPTPAHLAAEKFINDCGRNSHDEELADANLATLSAKKSSAIQCVIELATDGAPMFTDKDRKCLVLIGAHPCPIGG